MAAQDEDEYGESEGDSGRGPTPFFFRPSAGAAKAKPAAAKAKTAAKPAAMDEDDDATDEDDGSEEDLKDNKEGRSNSH